MRMKTILPFKPVISRLFCIAGITVAGSSLAEAAGVELTYPGAPLDENGLLFPQGSLSDNTVSITGGSIPGNAYGAKTTDGDTIRNRISMTGGSVLHLLGLIPRREPWNIIPSFLGAGRSPATFMAEKAAAETLNIIPSQ